jgi:ACS family hexuronate transporter-like MFS transporter
MILKQPQTGLADAPFRHAPGWRMWVAPTGMMLCTLLSYIDRQVLAVLSPMILSETGLNAESYATAVSAFSVLYMIGNPLWGSFLDYVGLRIGMLLAVTLWTAASVSHAWVAAFAGFAVARAVLGFGEGAAFPGALKTAADALPLNRQSRGMALGYSGASMGALLTPIIVTPIALKWGWRTAFLITGGLGAVWLMWWAFIARPPYLPSYRRGALRIQWPDLRERRLWVVVSSFGLGAIALGVAAYLSPLYLNRALGLTQAELGRVLWIPMLGWEAGYFFWGWVADRYAANEDRPVRIFVLLTFLSFPVALMTLTTSWVLALALFFWATFIADGFVVMSLRVGSRIFPRDRTGMVAGIGSGSWALVQAIILPVYGRWFDLQWYTATFVSMALLPIVGTLLWLWLSRPWASPQQAQAGA